MPDENEDMIPEGESMNFTNEVTIPQEKEKPTMDEAVEEKIEAVEEEEAPVTEEAPAPVEEEPAPEAESEETPEEPAPEPEKKEPQPEEAKAVAPTKKTKKERPPVHHDTEEQKEAIRKRLAQEKNTSSKVGNKIFFRG